MYWPRQIRSKHPELYSAIADGLSSLIYDPLEKMNTMMGSFWWENYADSVDRVLVHYYGDPEVVQAIENQLSGSVLFTGGGIVPPALIRSGTRFLHVHPGKLPHVRGVDGMLWSTLVRAFPGAACFI